MKKTKLRNTPYGVEYSITSNQAKRLLKRVDKKLNGKNLQIEFEPYKTDEEVSAKRFSVFYIEPFDMCLKDALNNELNKVLDKEDIVNVDIGMHFGSRLVLSIS